MPEGGGRSEFIGSVVSGLLDGDKGTVDGHEPAGPEEVSRTCDYFLVPSFSLTMSRVLQNSIGLRMVAQSSVKSAAADKHLAREVDKCTATGNEKQLL